MGFHFIGLAVHDQNPAAIGFPAGNPRRVLLVGQNDALVVFVPKLVVEVSGVGSRRSQNCSMKFSRSSSVLSPLKAAFSSGIDDVGDFFLEASSSERCRLFLFLACSLALFLFALPCQCQQGAQEETVRVRTIPLRLIGHLVRG